MTNSHATTPYRVAKLLKTYKRHNNIVIGVDFDFTLVDSENGYTLDEHLVSLLSKAQVLGCVLCIWTANHNQALVKAKWKEAKLKYSYYNSSPLSFGTAKPHFNLLLDDTAGLGQATEVLEHFISLVERGTDA